MRYLGIDFGLKKIGLALGEIETKLATPLEVISGGEEGFKILLDLIKSEDIDVVVSGLPESDYYSEQLELTKKFVQRLRDAVSVPVHTIDESFTTAESQKLQQEFGADAPEDALAAKLILESYFNILN